VAGKGAQFAKEVSGTKSLFNYTSQGPLRGARAGPYMASSKRLYLPQIFVMVSGSTPNSSAALSMAAVTFAPALTCSHTCSAIWVFDMWSMGLPRRRDTILILRCSHAGGLGSNKSAKFVRN